MGRGTASYGLPLRWLDWEASFVEDACVGDVEAGTGDFRMITGGDARMTFTYRTQVSQAGWMYCGGVAHVSLCPATPSGRGCIPRSRDAKRRRHESDDTLVGFH